MAETLDQIVRDVAAAMTPDQIATGLKQFSPYDKKSAFGFEVAPLNVTKERLPLFDMLGSSEGFRHRIISDHKDAFFSVHSPNSLAEAILKKDELSDAGEHVHGEITHRAADISVRHKSPEMLQALFDAGYKPDTHSAKQLVFTAIEEKGGKELGVLSKNIGKDEILSWKDMEFQYGRNAGGEPIMKSLTRDQIEEALSQVNRPKIELGAEDATRRIEATLYAMGSKQVEIDGLLSKAELDDVRKALAATPEDTKDATNSELLAGIEQAQKDGFKFERKGSLAR